ncbi:hypothetical protein ONY95_004633 [Vibrio parahaemolyticus]|nr:hypothetical protein [Vibrio parahaemolyticus]
MNLVLDIVKGKSEEFWWRLLSYFLSAFVVVPNIALLIFIVYMAEYDFFSYDFFIEGIFAMKWFFITTVLFLFVSSILIYSPIIFVFLYKKRAVKSKFLWSFFTLLSVWFWILIFLELWGGNDMPRILFVLFICFFSSVHIIALTCYPAKNQFVSLGVLVMVVVFSCFNYPTQVAQVASIGLKSFGVGGDVSISFTEPKTKANITGKLKLLTPKNIYLKSDSSEGISVYSLSSVDSYKVVVK